MPTKKFEVGDKVKIVANTSSHSFEIGTIVRIKEVPTGVIHDYKAEYLDKRNWWWINNEDIEFIKPKTTKMATTKATKEVATKKTAAKRAIPTTPLTRYSNYNIGRSDGIVKFGCGSVKVRREDLLTVADALEKGFKKVVTRAEKVGQRITNLTAKPKEIQDLLEVYGSFPKAKDALDRLKRGAGVYRTVSQILSIKPETLRRIAG